MSTGLLQPAPPRAPQKDIHLVVLMELLAGARDDADVDRLRRLVFGLEFLAVEGPADYERAAEIYRLCRRGGETPRKLSDCLIAAVAIRADSELLAADADLEVIARHADLRLLPAG